MRIGICTIVKNENPYIKQFVEYHKNLGITSIIVFDNNDIDGEQLTDVIGEYVPSFVNIQNIRGQDTFMLAHSVFRCMYDFNNEQRIFDWMIFLDIDEYIVLPEQYSNIQDYLSQDIFNNGDQIALPRKCFAVNSDIDVIYGEIPDNNFEFYSRDVTELETVDTSLTDNNYQARNENFKSIVRCGKPMSEVSVFGIYSVLQGQTVKQVLTDGTEYKNYYSIDNIEKDKINYDNGYIAHFPYIPLNQFFDKKISSKRFADLGSQEKCPWFPNIITNRYYDLLNKYYKVYNSLFKDDTQLARIMEYKYNKIHGISIYNTPHS